MKRLLTLVLALLCLTSCAGMLERDYLVTAPHVENPPIQGDAAYRVETYPALISALESYVEEGVEKGGLRFPTTYEGNVSVDMEKARRQMLEEDPLGSYALDDLTFHTSKIIAYYEVDLTFDYKVDKGELTSLPKAGGRKELTALLGETLEEFSPRLAVYLTQYPEEEETFFSAALQEAYDAHPAAALGWPELTVELYPKSGRRRVAVLELDYPKSRPALERQRGELDRAAKALSQEADPTARGVYQALRAACTLDRAGGSTAYDALVTGSANAEGMARGGLLLGRLAGLPCHLERRGDLWYIALSNDPAEAVWLDPTAPSFALLDPLPDPAEGQGEVTAP